MIKDLKYFFLLSRPLNVFITLLAFVLAAFIAKGNGILFFQDIDFWYACVALTVITASGYWVNDAFDFKIDRENKPNRVIVNAQLSVKKVLTAYFLVVILTLTASLLLQSFVLFWVNLAAVMLLFLYAWLLKRTTVIGNIVIATLTGLVIYYAALIYVPRTAIMWMIMFAFEVTFLREVVKDAEDIKGDLKFKLQTLPIRIGVSATRRVLQFCYLIFILSCNLPILEAAYREQAFNWPYLIASIVLVQIPAGYLLLDVGKAAGTTDFAKQSKYLKILIILGMLSVLLLV